MVSLKYTLDGVKTVRSIEGMNLSGVDCLIFNSSSDKDMSVLLSLSKIKGVVPKIIYISSKVDPLYYGMFSGLGADIYDNEDYLTDAGVVKYFIDSYKNTGLTMKPPSEDVETLAKSISAISSASEENIRTLVSNKLWLQTLSTSVTNVGVALERSSDVNTKSVESWREISKFIDALSVSNDVTKHEIDKLKVLITDLERNARPNAPFIFSTYTVPQVVNKVLYIRVLGSCRYLNSFVLAYQHYLKMRMQRSSKVLFALPKLKIHMQRYKDMARIAPDSIDILDISSSDVFVTFEPKKIVLDAFFGQSNVELFIVVDLMFSDPLLEGYMVDTFTAVSGVADVKRFNLKAARTIFPLVGLEDSLILPHIAEFAQKTESVRKTLYFKSCEKLYDVLDTVLFKENK